MLSAASQNNTIFHRRVCSVNKRRRQTGVIDAGAQMPFVMCVILGCCCICFILTIMYVDSTRIKRFHPLQSSWLNGSFRFRYLNASEAVFTDSPVNTTLRDTSRTVPTTKPSNSTLWDLYGCDKKMPLFSCRPHKDKSIKLPGNVVVVKQTDFNHPLLRKKLKNCAVVGSSGRLLKGEWGKDIDQHDVVVRVNYPPIKGYEKYVGSRHADIHFFSDKLQRCVNESYRSESQLVVFPLPLSINRQRAGFDICKENTNLRMLPMSNHLFERTTKLIYEYLLRHRKRGSKTPISKYPSAGFRAVFFCMMICSNVDVYGFGMSGDKSEPVHYYENGTDTTHFVTSHNPDAEFKLIVEWMKTESPKDLAKVRVF